MGPKASKQQKVREKIIPKKMTDNVRVAIVAFAAGHGTLLPAVLRRVEGLLRLNFDTFIGDGAQVVSVRRRNTDGMKKS